MDRTKLRIGLLFFLLVVGVTYISKRSFSSNWFTARETERKPVAARYVVLNDSGKRKRVTTRTTSILSSRRKTANSGRLGNQLPVQRYNILFWTKFYGDTFVPALRLHQEAVEGLKKCPYPNCDVINDHGSISNSSAVIFHIRDFSWNDIPVQQRLPSQYYIFYGLESPVHTTRDLDRINGFFNLTFTYRLDSDVVTDSYFQHFRPSVWNGEGDFRALWKVKKKLAVILVSNCHPPSRRDVYVQNLAKYVDIDIYGDCGTKHCSRDKHEECDKMVTKYKFYLAFENSVCKDYVTEKIHRAFNHGAVPVVYGGANYTAIFPKNSVINVLDYDSPELLAKYLLHLDKTPQDYMQYFMWRMRPATVALAPNLAPSNLSWCKICTLLNTQSPKSKRIVSDLGGWWNTKGWCVVPEVGRGDSEKLWEGKWGRNPAIPND